MGYRIAVKQCVYCQDGQEFVDGVGRVFCAKCHRFKAFEGKKRHIVQVPYAGDGLRVEELEKR